MRYAVELDAATVEAVRTLAYDRGVAVEAVLAELVQEGLDALLRRGAGGSAAVGLGLGGMGIVATGGSGGRGGATGGR